jgi:hypothetical protein
MRSLEDTMKYDLRLAWDFIEWELVKKYYADERPSPFGFSPGQMETKSTSTQPESLILAQSERWRQA